MGSEFMAMFGVKVATTTQASPDSSSMSMGYAPTAPLLPASAGITMLNNVTPPY
ncbi:MAG: hypothetical protein QNL05_00500 [Gammaproteobacteria bacterium]|nr:hypothetical protein [Gammaproteobacteria bacterium]